MRFDKFTIKSQNLIKNAQVFANEKGHEQIEPEHFLFAMFNDKESVANTILNKLRVSNKIILEEIAECIGKLPITSNISETYLSHNSKLILEKSFFEAKTMRDEYVSVEHILLALSVQDSMYGKQILNKNGVSHDSILAVLIEIRGSQSVTDPNPEEKYQALEKFGRDLTLMAQSGKLDPVIGRDDEIRRVVQVLSRRRKNNPVLIGEPGVGKTAIVEGLAQRIAVSDISESLKNRKLVCLDIGSLVAGAKYRGEFEDRLKSVLKEVAQSNGQIVLFIDELHTLVGAGATEGAMDASNMLKPMLARGTLRCIGATTLSEYRKYLEKDAALERRFQPVVVSEPTVTDTVSILRGLKDKYELHHGVRIKDSAILSAASLSDRYIMGRFLPDKAIDLIDEAASKLRIEIDSMPVEIDEIQRKIMQLEIEREALKNESDSISLDRLSCLKEDIDLMRSKANKLKLYWQNEKTLIQNIRNIKEEQEKLSIEEQQAELKGDLAKVAELRYGKRTELNSALEKARNQLEKLQSKGKMLKEEVDDEDIAHVISNWTGIPVNKMLEEEREKLINMEKRIEKRVVGQKRAISAVANAVRRARSGLQDPDRPSGSFIFMGPTGVGKTELAKSLAEFLFNDDSAIIRIDMSEYMEKHSVSKLIGAPPGYVGYNEGGYLTESVRLRPYSVVLFDEIEKAHQDVLNILLQILDDGHLTDSQGKTVNFKNTIIVMTSNIGSKLIQDFAGKEFNKMEKQVIALLQDILKPELLNRIDETIVFLSLSKKEILNIVEIQIERLSKRLDSRGIQLHLSKSIKEFIASRGYDPIYGARLLKRTIQNHIENPMALAILEEKISKNSLVKMEIDNYNNVTLNVKKI